MILTKYNVEIDTEADKIEKPESRWRNKHLVVSPLVTCRKTGDTFTRGDIVSGLKTWPSKDIAETIGIQDEFRNRGMSKFLGSFPESQDADH